MSTGFIAELIRKCDHNQLPDHKQTLFNIIESVLYLDAKRADAREQLDQLWSDIEAEIELLSEPLDEEQLGLLNPTFDVD
ncbi:hypothetical protein OAW32_02530 [bacterium]|jgi:hypothetical protein|nr:hypothetical protein [bacterium]|tara:strand:+ start:215 stop:454 length:240 start_codon:yes stop_codon:yes gene_type:complete